jgi:hypothetical protein
MLHRSKAALVAAAGWMALWPGAPAQGRGDRGGPAAAVPTARRSNGGTGWVPGLERLGIPDLNMADSAVGVTHGAAESRYSTLLPSASGAAATWNAELALLYGQVIGRELRDQGYNASIGRGREYYARAAQRAQLRIRGRGPILAGTTAGVPDCVSDLRRGRRNVRL